MLIPKYSGDQYNTGRKIPPSQAKRGDLIFCGPGGSQHVAIYLGGGQMLEASGSAEKVTVSPVRTAGLSAVPGAHHRVLSEDRADAEQPGQRRRIPNCLE